MGKIRIIKRPPHELIIAERPLISELIGSLIIGSSIGGVLLGIGLFVAGQFSYRGSLTTLQCTHQGHLTCKMTVVDARGKLIHQAEVSPVQKVDIVPTVSSKEVCSDSGEGRECSTVMYYECPIRLHSPQTSLTVPISALTQETSSLAETCPKQNFYSAQFERLISGEQKSGFWSEDTRIGDILTPFKQNIAAYIPAVFLGLPALLCFLTNRQQRTVKFDNLRQTVELQTKDWFGKITTKTWSTRNLTFVNYDAGTLFLLEKCGNLCSRIKIESFGTSYDLYGAVKDIESFLLSDFRSYRIDSYILDQSPEQLQLYEYDFAQPDFHGSLIWSIDALTKKIQFVKKKPIPEVGWDKIQFLQIVRREGSDEDTYELGLVTNYPDSFVLLSECENLDRTEQIGEKIAKFLGVPLRKAWKL